MERKLFGMKNNSETDKAIRFLEDAKLEYEMIDVGYTNSSTKQALEIISNSLNLPVLFVEGVAYIGVESIREHHR
jgi:glutaredoxin